MTEHGIIMFLNMHLKPHFPKGGTRASWEAPKHIGLICSSGISSYKHKIPIDMLLFFISHVHLISGMPAPVRHKPLISYSPNCNQLNSKVTSTIMFPTDRASSFTVPLCRCISLHAFLILHVTKTRNKYMIHCIFPLIPSLGSLSECNHSHVLVRKKETHGTVISGFPLPAEGGPLPPQPPHSYQRSYQGCTPGRLVRGIG